MSPAHSGRSLLGTLTAFWGVIGVILMLTRAISRLSPLAWQTVTEPRTGLEWTVLVGYAVFMLYSEGYRGFHLRFSPRVVARALHLSRNPTPWWRCVLAPLYCMSLFGASKRGMLVARVLLLAIVALVILIRFVPAPWRGIIDVGVVIGLTVGIASIVYFALRALLGRPADFDPDLPTEAASA